VPSWRRGWSRRAAPDRSMALEGWACRDMGDVRAHGADALGASSPARSRRRTSAASVSIAEFARHQPRYLGLTAYLAFLAIILRQLGSAESDAGTGYLDGGQIGVSGGRRRSREVRCRSALSSFGQQVGIALLVVFDESCLL